MTHRKRWAPAPHSQPGRYPPRPLRGVGPAASIPPAGRVARLAEHVVDAGASLIPSCHRLRQVTGAAALVGHIGDRFAAVK